MMNEFEINGQRIISYSGLVSYLTNSIWGEVFWCVICVFCNAAAASLRTKYSEITNREPVRTEMKAICVEECPGLYH